MILAHAAEVSSEVDAMALFLGGSHIERLSTTSASDDLQAKRSVNVQGGSNSIFVLAGLDGISELSDLHGVLSRCQSRLVPNGRLAVVFENTRRLGLLSFPRRLSDAADPAPPRAGLPLAAVLGMLRRTGFHHDGTFVLRPSAARPSTIHPAKRWDTFRAPAYLVTAGLDRSAPGFLLDRIISTLSTAPPGGRARPSGRLVGVFNSSRGKSVALLQLGGQRVVVRLARSEVMLADEARSHALLDKLQRNEAVAGRIPRPLAAGMMEDIHYFAQSHLPGVPLSSKIRTSTRSAHLADVEGFLRSLNQGMRNDAIVRLDSAAASDLILPMARFALEHVADAALRERTRALLAETLREASCAFGATHGDFGTANILTDGHRITGVIDWEAARERAPLVLDAINYLDSAYRSCDRGLGTADALPTLAAGRWPIAAETEFLKRHFAFCGAELRHLKGFSVLYALFHFGPQLRFAATETGPAQRLARVLQGLVSG